MNKGTGHVVRLVGIHGQSLVEYGMLLALVALVSIVVIKTTGNKAAGTYDNIQGEMTSQGLASVVPQAPSGSGGGSSGGSGGDSGGDDHEDGSRGGGHHRGH